MVPVGHSVSLADRLQRLLDGAPHGQHNIYLWPEEWGEIIAALNDRHGGFEMDRLDQLLDHYGHAIEQYWNGRAGTAPIDAAAKAIRAEFVPKPRAMEEAAASLARQVIALHEIKQQTGAIGAPYNEPAEVRLARAILAHAP